jgi:hypothetical protein
MFLCGGMLIVDGIGRRIEYRYEARGGEFVELCITFVLERMGIQWAFVILVFATFVGSLCLLCNTFVY